MRFFCAALALIGLIVSADAFPRGRAATLPATYYISPTGNDSSNGLSSGAAWLTPNHSVKCGDVILAAAGAYSSDNLGPRANGSGNFGTVSNCPSTAGVYFAQLKCVGPYVSSCAVTSTNGNAAIWVNKSNWAVIGFAASSTTGSCFVAEPLTGATIHHVAFINVIANGCLYAGISSEPYWNNYAYGVDQFSVVGAIVYSSAHVSNAICSSGVSVFHPRNFDSSAGTHIFVSGVFSYSNIDGCTGHTDGEGIIFDDWADLQFDSVPYLGQGVIEQSMTIGNGGSGILVFNNTEASVYVISNTAYGDYQDTSFSHAGGEFYVFYDFSTNTGIVSATGNIFQATLSTQNSYNIYGASVGNGGTGDSISGNYIFGVSGNNTNVAGGGFTFGTNTYADPNFVNPTTPGAPTCATAATTTACMAPTIANFTAQAVGAAGLGYHAPGPCSPDAYFPTWLDGVIPVGLITQPCGTN